MANNDWELMVDSDGIEVGSDIRVETEDGVELVMKVKRYNDTFVWLKDGSGKVFRFSAETLESDSGDSMIVGVG